MLRKEDFSLLQEWNSASPEMTEGFAVQLYDRYLSGAPLSILLLEGEMGAGKTTFVHGFGSALGIDGVINSPTFNLCNHYDGSQGELFHYDLYRLSSPDEVEDLGFADDWSSSRAPGSRPAIHVIEWFERAEGLFPSRIPTYLVTLQIAGDEMEGPRTIHVYRRND